MTDHIKYGEPLSTTGKIVSAFVVLVMASAMTIGIASPKEKSDKLVRNVSAKVYFSPKGGCTEAIVREVRQARKEILVQAFSFTSDTIADELIKASKRGVTVRVILDRGQRESLGGDATKLIGEGIFVRFDTKFAIAHSKVMVIDDQTVITGSFNFTASAENRNLENLLILQSKSLAETYEDNWNHTLTYAIPFK